MMQQTTLPQEIQLAEWARGAKRSILREMIAVVSRAGILSFAGGLPAPELFPKAELAQAYQKVLASNPDCLQYQPPLKSLKKYIVELMAMRGVHCQEGQVFLTTGAQQGLDVLTRLLLNPGGEVALEEIVYTGAQQAVIPFQPQIIAISTDLETGMEVDELAAHLALGARPAYIYTIPQAHNPLGVTLSLDKRHQLVDLATRYGIPIIEDDPYGFLSYHCEPMPPIYSLNNDWVFYLGSFSKIIAPSLRLGWIVAPEHLIPRLTVIKEAGDLESSGLTQLAVSAYLASGAFPSHLKKLIKAYGSRMDAMLNALENYFPNEASWTVPSGGMFIWVELSDHIDSVKLLEFAVAEEQVAFIPGHAFALPDFPDVQCRARHSLRLSFSNCTSEQIEDGICRLAKAIHRY